MEHSSYYRASLVICPPKVWARQVHVGVRKSDFSSPKTVKNHKNRSKIFPPGSAGPGYIGLVTRRDRLTNYTIGTLHLYAL